MNTDRISELRKEWEAEEKPKSEDARQPQCTPEKEEAIMQALRHYGMI